MIRLTNPQQPTPDLGIEPPEWTLSAVCASVDPELFYPEKGASTAAAKAVCRGCPVVAECLAYALQNSERFGIWGALSERERRRVAAGKPIAQPPTEGPCPHCGKQCRNVRMHITSVHPGVRGAA